MENNRAINIEDILADRRARPFQIRLLMLLALFMFFEGYDVQVLSFAAPVIIKTWHSNKAAFGGVFGGAMAGFMFGAMVIGNLGDYFGRARMIIYGSIPFGVFTIFSACATNLHELLYWRVIAGIGLGGAVPNAVVLLTEYWPVNMRATSVMLIYLGYTIGSALGGIIAAYLIPTYGWQSVFILGGVAPLLAVVILWVWLPESVQFLATRRKRPDRVVHLLRKLQPGTHFSEATRLALPASPEKGMPAGKLFTGGRAMMTCMLWLGCICSTITLHFLTSWLPVVIEGEGVPLGHAIIATSILQASGAVGNIVAGRLLDRRGIGAYALFILCAIPCLFLLSHVVGAEVLTMIFVGCCGFFIIGSFGILLALSSVIYPAQMRGTGSGWTYGISRVGAIIGPMIGGLLLSHNLGPKTLFQLAMVPVTIQFCAILILSRQPASKILLASRHNKDGTELMEPAEL